MRVNKKDRYWIPKPNKKWQTQEDNKFYHSRAWRKLRNYFIKKHPLCEECKKKGIIKAANVVDHIIPIKQGGTELDESNLQSLCTSCHNSKSSKERL